MSIDMASEGLHPSQGGHLLCEHDGYQIWWRPGAFAVTYGGRHLTEFGSYRQALDFVAACAASDAEMHIHGC
jgi:hypothetical protein